MNKPVEYIEVYQEGPLKWRYCWVSADGLRSVEPEVFHSELEAKGAAFLDHPKAPIRGAT